MFQNACQTIRESVYGVKCATQIDANTQNVSTGTGFMVSPTVVATAAHVVHVEGDITKAVQQKFEVIRAPDIGQMTDPAQLIAEDAALDIAFLRLEKPRSNQCVVLEPNILSAGISCGSLGFPLSFVDPQNRYCLLLRFQGAFISAFNRELQPSGQFIEYYETDSLMYNGSSGCPEFAVDGRVFGMQSKVRTSNPQANPQPIPQNRQQRRQQMRQRQKQRLRNAGKQVQTERFAISMLVPSTHIIAFAHVNAINV